MGDMADFYLEQSEAEVEHYYRYANAPLHVQYEEGLIDESGRTIGNPGSGPYRGGRRVSHRPTQQATGPGQCPKCGGKTNRRTGKYGAFYGCAQFPACNGSRKAE